LSELKGKTVTETASVTAFGKSKVEQEDLIVCFALLKRMQLEEGESSKVFLKVQKDLIVYEVKV
jgi:hypothetical protein